ncbi:Phosphoenolpyruvate-dependent phosphotransferase system [Alphaproteobacteria bacterium SO-S41]|nr:Phosphoenolpyruvate-dependent phosphotransferase system [Alphaproteobacteria bacterium SO-S41]
MVTSAAGNPRLLLRRLRDIMQERTSAQDRLDRIVTLIANNMVAEVCSIYLMRTGGELELFATEGLNKNAVHNARLKKGEGLVGDIALHARPLNLPDAQSHPNFVFLPETGESPFQSLMGVPILRDGLCLGVIVVQNKTRRLYDEEEVEAAQTIAMVLAEMVASGDLVSPNELEETGIRRDKPWRAKGSAIADGVAIGLVVLHEPRVKVERLIAEDPEAERARLDRAVSALRSSVDEMVDHEDMDLLGDTKEVLEAYRMFANDSGWLVRLREAISTGLTAEAAVERVQSETRARLMRHTDPYLRERAHDLDDLANRLLRHLAGLADTAAGAALPDDVVLVARAMGPAELLDYDRTKLKAVALEEGSPTSHVAIVARALGIPLVGRIENLVDQADNGNQIVVDGERGEVHLRPAPDVVTAYRAKLAVMAQREQEYAALRDAPAVTRDGALVALNLNAGLAVDLPHLDETGAAGIGLFRTELPFMITARLPNLKQQTDLYNRVLDVAGERPVVFRTLDLGGDKVLPYMHLDAEENPAMGWRAIRISLDRPALLRYQLRAMIAAAAGRSLNIMFPMIAEVAEFAQARALLDQELKRAAALGQTLPLSVRAGTMVEVPSLGWSLEPLLAIADFISLGTNDLMQFFFASDRGNPRLGDRYDALSPAFLRFIKACVEACRTAKKSIAVCGEMAGRPLEALALMALGITQLSMQPHGIGPVKLAIRSVELAPLRAFLETHLDDPGHSLRADFRALAEQHGAKLG